MAKQEEIPKIRIYKGKGEQCNGCCCVPENVVLDAFRIGPTLVIELCPECQALFGMLLGARHFERISGKEVFSGVSPT